MNKQVICAYFSGTGTTKKTVEKIGEALSEKLNLPCSSWDFTLPAARKEVKSFGEDDIVIFGTPVIAGRVPNVLLKFLETIQGGNAIGIPIVCFGNRAFDDGLIELKDILENSQMRIVAAGGFPCEHSFSRILGQGRPDEDDLIILNLFAEMISKKILAGNVSGTIEVSGTPKPYSGYYTPRDREGNPVDIRKVTPVTDMEKCVDCKICANLCPLGSIDFEDVSKMTGICMKCCACIKGCPLGAKNFTDKNYLYHQYELEEGYKRRGNASLFV
ncbi:MAG: EFR1 family ferrodoxin [Anaerovoracaceae bacterium]